MNNYIIASMLNMIKQFTKKVEFNWNEEYQQISSRKRQLIKKRWWSAEASLVFMAFYKAVAKAFLLALIWYKNGLSKGCTYSGTYLHYCSIIVQKILMTFRVLPTENKAYLYDLIQTIFNLLIAYCMFNITWKVHCKIKGRTPSTSSCQFDPLLKLYMYLKFLLCFLMCYMHLCLFNCLLSRR